MTEPKKRNISGLKPFKKGFDPRRNLKGKPKSFDQLREFLQSIAHEEVKDGNEMKTNIRIIAESMINDKRLMKDFLEFAYGKVPLSQIIKVDEHSTISWKEFINGYGNTDSDPGNKQS